MNESAKWNYEQLQTKVGSTRSLWEDSMGSKRMGPTPAFKCRLFTRCQHSALFSGASLVRGCNANSCIHSSSVAAETQHVQPPRVTTCMGLHLTSRSTNNAYCIDTCPP
eukprot:scaffold125459_cov18-Prasinocladus_malaysianus.AAC.1